MSLAHTDHHGSTTRASPVTEHPRDRAFDFQEDS